MVLVRKAQQAGRHTLALESGEGGDALRVRDAIILVADDDERLRMQSAIRALATPNAADDIAEIVIRTAKQAMA